MSDSDTGGRMTPHRNPGHLSAPRAFLLASILGVVGVAIGARGKLLPAKIDTPSESAASTAFPPGTEIDSALFRRLVVDRWRFVPSLHQRKPATWKGSAVWQFVVERPRTSLAATIGQFLHLSAKPRSGGRIDLRILFLDSTGKAFDTTTIDATFDSWMHRVSDASSENPSRLAFQQESRDVMILELPNYADTVGMLGFIPSWRTTFRRADSLPPPWMTPLPPPLDSLAMREGIKGTWRFVPTPEHATPQDWINGDVWQIVIEPCDDRKDHTFQEWTRVMSYTQAPVPRKRDNMLADLRIRFLDAKGRDLDTVAFDARFDAASRSIEGRAFARKKWPEIHFTLAHTDTLIFQHDSYLERAYTRVSRPSGSSPTP